MQTKNNRYERMTNMKKVNGKSFITISALTLGMMAAFSGCGTKASGAETTAAEVSNIAGTVMLSVNPEIEIGYDENGKVLELEGINEDGKSIVSSHSGYENKECEIVLADLVKEIHKAGYFEQTVDGNAKNVVLKLSEGSEYPDDDFVYDLAESVREAVAECELDSEAVSISEDDLDENGYIGIEKAQELLKAQLGLDDVTFHSKDYDLDDGVYEFEFVSKGVEYEYEVDAVSGKVREADKVNNDDWAAQDADDADDKNDDKADDKQNETVIKIPVGGDDRDDSDDGNDDADDRDDGRDDSDDRNDDADDRDDDRDDYSGSNDDSDDGNDDADDQYDDDAYEPDDDDDDYQPAAPPASAPANPPASAPAAPAAPPASAPVNPPVNDDADDDDGDDDGDDDSDDGDDD
ncbi:MAG: hypothetical protein EOM18_02955 [Clostridia bacterium]|nr:hypothetical protein [Clostridia bacterium]